MKSFQYTAKDQQGQLVTGVIETSHFADASSKIQSRGLELISLEELRGHMQQFNSFIFEAVDIEGEAIQGTLTGADESEIRQRLRDELGYQVKNVQIKDAPASHAPQVIHVAVKDDEAEKSHSSEVLEKRKENIAQAQKAMDQAAPMKKEENIIFQRQPKMFFDKAAVSNEELDQEQRRIEQLLKEKNDILSPSIKDRLSYLLNMIEHIRDNRNKKRWKNLRNELRKVEKMALHEIEQHEEMTWKKLERQDPGKKIENYQDFPDRSRFRLDGQESAFARLKKWAHMISEPDETKDGEVLVKQQYESIWVELQRFSGALLAFYMLVYLASYYLMRGGLEDHFLIRIYDTTLFKQLILVVFCFYGLLALRNDFFGKNFVRDSIFAGIWIASFALIFW